LLARPALITALDRAAVDAGFGVRQSIVRGNRTASEAEIRAALALDGTRSHLTLDLAELTRRIEALAWVQKAELQRLLPDGVAVGIRERVAVAVWRGPAEDTLIDAGGRRLTAIPRGADTGLPVLTGEGAGPAAPGILPLIAANREIDRRLVETRRIADRRWTLVLTSDVLVHLPGDGVAGAMAWLDSQARTGLLDQPLEAIDLRVQGSLVLRERGAADRTETSERTAAMLPAAPGGR